MMEPDLSENKSVDHDDSVSVDEGDRYKRQKLEIQRKITTTDDDAAAITNQTDEDAAMAANQSTSETSIKMLTLLENFSESQFRRYEMYRRSKFSKSMIKKLVKHITGGQLVINEKTSIALAGVAKVYVGQLIETDYMEELGCSQGPVQPKHLREAVRRLRNKSKVMIR